MNDNDHAIEGGNRALEDEAIEWLVRLRGPDGPAAKGRFEQWRSRSAEHRRAFEWAERHFDASAILKQSEHHGAANSSRPGKARWLLAGLAVAAAASVLLVALGNREVAQEAGLLPGPSGPQSVLATPLGEIRTIRLADGSAVTLDARSKLTMSIDRSVRRFDLKQGRARFVVASDARPFVVSAGAGQITTSGGSFDVGLDDRHVMLTLISGDAVVRPEPGSTAFAAPARQVYAGQGYSYRTFDFGQFVKASASPGVDDRNWPDGWFEYRSVPLHVLVEQANRYGRQKVVLDDPGVGALDVTGRFRLTDSSAFAARICEAFNLELARENGAIHLRRK